jgi:hypothetical protein
MTVAGCWLVLVLALLPAITYMGHWPIGTGEAHEASHESSTAADHELHCHGGVAKCAGGEAMVGTTWIGEDSAILSLTSPYVEISGGESLAPIEGAHSRILRPPRVV